MSTILTWISGHLRAITDMVCDGVRLALLGMNGLHFGIGGWTYRATDVSCADAAYLEAVLDWNCYHSGWEELRKVITEKRGDRDDRDECLNCKEGTSVLCLKLFIPHAVDVRTVGIDGS